MTAQEDKEEQKTFSLLKHGRPLSGFHQPAQKWLIEDVLPTTALTLIYAPTGGQKSLLTLDMVRSVATGTEWLGKKANKAKVIYVDGEMSERNISQRVESMGISNIPECDFSYIATSLIDEFEFDLNKQSFRQSFIQELKESNCKLLVLDNIRTLLVMADENSSSEYTNFNNFIKTVRGMGITIIVVHHSNKNKSETGQTSYAGSSNVATVYDQVIELQCDSDKCLTLNLHKDRDATGSSFLEQINIKYIPPKGYQILTTEMCEEVDHLARIKLAKCLIMLVKASPHATPKSLLPLLRAQGHNFKNPVPLNLTTLFTDLIEGYDNTYSTAKAFEVARRNMQVDFNSKLLESNEYQGMFA